VEKTATTRENKSIRAPTESVFVPQASGLSSVHVLHLAWQPDTSDKLAVAFAVSIASHFFESCSAVLVETRDGELLDDLDELVASIRSGRVATITFRTGHVDLAGDWRLEFTPSESGPKVRCSLAVTVCDDEQSWTQVDWLQASFAHPSPMPVLAIPRGPGGVSVSVFHGLVVLAARFGRVDRAELERSEGSERVVTTARWHFDDPPEGAVPVIPHEGETLWLATATPPSAAAKAACWVEVVDAGMPRDLQMSAAPDLAWQNRFTALLAVAPHDSAELVAHLQQLAPVLVPFRIDPLNATPSLESMVPTQDGIVCMLVPTESVVHIGVDFDQAEDVVKQALLHAYGHLLLGHLRPSCGSQQTHSWQGKHTEDREQTHQPTDPDQTVGASDDLCLENGAHA
jgi:hypothetical protein